MKTAVIQGNSSTLLLTRVRSIFVWGVTCEISYFKIYIRRHRYRGKLNSIKFSCNQMRRACGLILWLKLRFIFFVYFLSRGTGRAFQYQIRKFIRLLVISIGLKFWNLPQNFKIAQVFLFIKKGILDKFVFFSFGTEFIWQRFFEFFLFNSQNLCKIVFMLNLGHFYWEKRGLAL